MDNFETPEQRLRKIQNELNTAKAQTFPADAEKTAENAESAEIAESAKAESAKKEEN